MKNLNLIFIIIALSVGCRTTKEEKDSTNSYPNDKNKFIDSIVNNQDLLNPVCKNFTTCDSIMKCYYNYYNCYDECGVSRDEYFKMKDCALVEIMKGNYEAHYPLLNFSNTLYKKRNLLNHFIDDSQKEILRFLRGPDALELAIKYMDVLSEPSKNPFDHDGANTLVVPGAMGILAGYVNNIVKPINGRRFSYFLMDKYIENLQKKNPKWKLQDASLAVQDIRDSDHGKSESDFYRQELKKLYAEGKLELYKYGEPLIKTD